jgi:pimeloyl-ACP methyl ester carboxylesterase
VVYSHGNAESLSTLGWYIRELSNVLQSNVYAYEYEGYYVDARKTEAVEPSEEACFANSEKFVAALLKRSSLPVILFGYSMGSAVTLHAAQVHKGHAVPHAVVLLAPFVSAASTVLARKSFMISVSSLWSWSDVFVMRSAALEQGHATFIAHGTIDEVIPVSHGQAIARWVEKHSSRTKFVEMADATHGSIRVSPRVYQDLLVFLSSL